MTSIHDFGANRRRVDPHARAVSTNLSALPLTDQVKTPTCMTAVERGERSPGILAHQSLGYLLNKILSLLKGKKLFKMFMTLHLFDTMDSSNDCKQLPPKQQETANREVPQANAYVTRCIPYSPVNYNMVSECRLFHQSMLAFNSFTQKEKKKSCVWSASWQDTRLPCFIPG